jgi:uroporphyrinogen-III synthase
MKVIVTRPAAQAQEWVARLAARGIDATPLPLIEIAEAPDPAAVAAAWRALATRALVVFVSPSAVECFFAVRPPEAAWPEATRAASVGPGTTAALRRVGVPAAAIVEPPEDAPQFDSESLWASLREERWAGRHVLLARGDGGREWLADRLRDAGAEVQALAVYRRVAPDFDRTQRSTLRAALDDPAAHLWLFSSSEAIDRLEALVGAHDWRRAGALATHPRIAERARALGIGRVIEARAAFDAVAACILATSVQR